ncbi:protamine-like protein [Ctenocephalides felis]|uniref:protamine-like protein n=1 Tax=Ctenocephalides felis TaxID=7515 RepID=UPI000E6E10C1|nr:protamine-like protein [Ctenocephalides felis]
MSDKNSTNNKINKMLFALALLNDSQESAIDPSTMKTQVKKALCQAVSNGLVALTDVSKNMYSDEEQAALTPHILAARRRRTQRSTRRKGRKSRGRKSRRASRRGASKRRASRRGASKRRASRRGASKRRASKRAVPKRRARSAKRRATRRRIYKRLGSIPSRKPRYQ